MEFDSWLELNLYGPGCCCLVLPRPYGPFGLVSARMSLTETHVVSGSSFWRDSCNQAKTHLGPLGLVLVRYMDPRHILLDDSCCISFIVVTVMIVNCGRLDVWPTPQGVVWVGLARTRASRDLVVSGVTHVIILCKVILTRLTW